MQDFRIFYLLLHLLNIRFTVSVHLYVFIINFSNLLHLPSKFHLLFYLLHKQQHSCHTILHSFFTLQFSLFLQVTTFSPFWVRLKYLFYLIYYHNQLLLNRKYFQFQHLINLISFFQTHFIQVQQRQYFSIFGRILPLMNELLQILDQGKKLLKKMLRFI